MLKNRHNYYDNLSYDFPMIFPYMLPSFGHYWPPPTWETNELRNPMIMASRVSEMFTPILTSIDLLLAQAPPSPKTGVVLLKDPKFPLIGPKILQK